MANRAQVADLRQRIDDKDEHIKHLTTLIKTCETLEATYQNDLTKRTEENEMLVRIDSGRMETSTHTVGRQLPTRLRSMTSSSSLRKHAR